MPLTRIEAENFTVFENISIPFGEGLSLCVSGIGHCQNRYVIYDKNS